MMVWVVWKVVSLLVSCLCTQLNNINIKRMKKTYHFLVLSILSTAIMIGCSSTKTYLLTSEGESFDSLTKITDNARPSIDPHGGDLNKNLVFSGQENDGTYNIYLKDNVLSKAIIKKTSGNSFNLSPNYCSANNKIVFQYFDNTNFDIYYVDAYGGKAITQITNTDENEYNPSWSKDGKRIIFEKGGPPKLYIKVTQRTYKAARYSGISVTNNQIWLKNIETGELKMLGEGSFPSFSPDGNEIAFVKYEINKGKEIGTIWTMSIDGDSPKQLTDNQMGYATQPNWNPSGDNIVFNLTKNKETTSDIYSVSIDGENLRQHTTNESNDFSPYWSSDNYIYFSSDRGTKQGNYQIWRFKIL